MRSDSRLRLVERIIRLEAIRRAQDASGVFKQVEAGWRDTLRLVRSANDTADKTGQHQNELLKTAFKLDSLVDRADEASRKALDASDSVDDKSKRAQEAQRLTELSKQRAEVIVADLSKSMGNVSATEQKVYSIAESMERKLTRERTAANEAKKSAEETARALEALLPLVKRIEYRKDGCLWAVYSDDSEAKIVKLPKNNAFGGFVQATGGGGGGSFTFTVTTAAAYTMSSTERTFLMVDATAGNVTVTLPLASTVPTMEYMVQKIDSSLNTVTLTGDSINGDGDAIIIRRNTAAHLYPTPSNGYRIG